MGLKEIQKQLKYVPLNGEVAADSQQIEKAAQEEYDNKIMKTELLKLPIDKRIIAAQKKADVINSIRAKKKKGFSS